MGNARLRIRANSIRKTLCEMCFGADSGHPSSSLSVADIMATLYFSEMHCEPTLPKDESDILILSKGHAAPAMYATLMEKGFISENLKDKLRCIDSPLQGHPDVNRLDHMNASTGALGQGLSMAIGRALAIQSKGEERYVYCIVGDGESQEGQMWEAALFGGNHSLPNLIAITDYNKGQSDGHLADIMPMGDLAKKWEVFGWFVLEIDGHDIAQIRDAIYLSKNKGDNRPTMIIANTVKGYIDTDYQILDGDHGGKIVEELLASVSQHSAQANAALTSLEERIEKSIDTSKTSIGNSKPPMHEERLCSENCINTY